MASWLRVADLINRSVISTPDDIDIFPTTLLAMLSSPLVPYKVY